MAERNLYEILGVPRTAPEGDIRKAYRRIARESHPDRNPGDKRAEDRFKEASFAKEVLLNAGKRALYDEFGEMGLREGFDAESYRRYNAARSRGVGGMGGGEASLEDLFSAIGGQPGSGAGKGGGFGGWGGFQDFVHGDGGESIFGRARRAKRDLVSEIEVSFEEALRGTEKEISFQVPGGPPKTLRARIPRGVQDGGRVRLRGHGADGGDLVLKVRVAPHAVFTRDGQDLLLSVPITVGEAYRGGKISVPTAEGPVQLTVPAGVASGAKLRLRGRGVERGKEKGDLIVTLQLTLPPAGNEEADRAIDALERAYPEDVRAGLSV